MPLEIPKSPVQHPHHRASGFSIPGRLPCLLAVVLGLFAHSEALAQRLASLTIEADDGVTVTPSIAPGEFNPDRFDYTATVENSETGLRVRAIAKTNHRFTYDPPSGQVSPVPVGTRRLAVTVTVTDDSVPPKTQDYRIYVTRPAATTLDELAVDFGVGGGLLPGETLVFDSATRNYEAIVTKATTAVTFTATLTNSTATITWDSGSPGPPHTRNLGTGLNIITATVTDDTSIGRYIFRLTKSDTPGAPRSLRVTGSASDVGGEVTLSWSAPSDDNDADIDYYEVARYDEFDEEDDADGQLTDDELATANRWENVGDVLSRRVTGLSNGRTYYFRVRAHNHNGEGNGSNDDSATPEGRLSAPVNLEATRGNARVELTWDAPTPFSSDSRNATLNPISSYEYSQDGGQSWRSIPNSDESTTSHTVTGLRNEITYYFRVRAKNRAGNGFPSEEVRDGPESGEPGAPTELTAQAGDEEVTLSWRAPANSGGEPITEYQYWYDDEPLTDAAAAVWITTGGTGTTVTVHGLTNGTPYFFKVRAVNDLGCTGAEMEGCGQGSLEVSAKPVGKPVTEVVQLPAESDKDSWVRLTWTTVPHELDELIGFEYRQREGGGYGSWIDIRNSDASTLTHVVRDLTNGRTYTFEVRAVNSSGGGLASNEESAVPSIPPGAPTLTATAGDKQVELTWTPAADGGRRIIRYECRWRTGGAPYEMDAMDRCGQKLGASAMSLTLTDDDDIKNDKIYTFQVRAVNDRENTVGPRAGNGDWSKPATAKPTDGSGTQQTFTISATIDGKSWARASESATILATVEVNPRYTAPSTSLWVGAGSVTPKEVMFGPTNSSRDVSITVTTPNSAGDLTIALLGSLPTDPPEPDTNLSNALAVTRVEIRPDTTPEPPTGLEATRGDGEVTLSWATDMNSVNTRRPVDHEYRQRRQPGSYGRWTNFAGEEFQLQNQGRTVTSNTVTGLTNGGTYAFQVRALGATPEAVSDPSDEVSVSLSGTPPVQTGALSAPRNVAAAPGNGQVTLSWGVPASDGGAAISGYQYQLRAGAGAYGQWTTVPGGGPSRSYIVTGLTNGTGYYFRVRAVNSDGPGPPSTEESATPSLTVDTTLSALSLSTVTVTPAPVTLAPAFTPATRTYTAAVGSNVTQVTVTATPNKAGATRTITPADANTAVADHVVALVVGPNPIRVTVTDGTNADDYTITVTRAVSVPAAPTGLTATAGEDGDGAVTLSWTAPTGGGAVSRYEYQQKAGTGAYGAWTPIPNSGASTTSYTVPSLTDGTAYTFRVRAVNSAGAGAASTEATATPTTGRLVWAKSEQEVAAVIALAMAAGFGDDMTFDAGEEIEILGSALFNAAPGVTLSYEAVSSNSVVASAGIIDTVTVTVMARAGGMADITITAMASLPSGLIDPQTDPREASITFPVEVDIEALVLELVGPADMNLVEGGSDVDGTAGRATVTVQANRPVTREVTVTLLADRAMGDATADDFEAAPIVLGAGATAGSTVVTAVDDGMAEDREALVLFGIAADNAGEVQGEVTLYLWDAAVPALPIIAQLLLAAFLLWVSGRRYLLRR